MDRPPLENVVTPNVGAVTPKSEGAALAVLGLVWIVLAVVVNPLGDFPLNDDWVYALAVRSILGTGNFALPSPASSNVIAQAYWGALFCFPFGFSFNALRISTLVLGGVGILALFLLLRELGARRGLAAAGALTMAVNPFYLGLSASFMTDVPFTALVTLSLWLYVRGVRREDRVLLAGAFVVAFMAIMIRQFALVLPVAFGAAHVMRKGVGPRAVAFAALPIVLAVVLQIIYQRWLFATGRTPMIAVPLEGLVPETELSLAHRTISVALTFLPYIGLCVAPFVACLNLPQIYRPASDVWRYLLSWRVSTLLWLMLVAALVVTRNFLPAFGHIIPTFDNILIPSGMGALTLRDIYVLQTNQPQVPGIVSELWAVATMFSAWIAVLVILGILYMLTMLVSNARDLELRRAAWAQVLMITVLSVYLGGMFLINNNGRVYDRYLLPLIPPVLAALVLGPGYSHQAPGITGRGVLLVLLLGLYAAFSVSATHDYLAWNRARWQATDSLARAGVTPHRIDGGYEFNGWYLYSANYQRQPSKSYWWVDDDEYVIASGPLSGYQETERFPVNRWLPLTEANVVVLHRATGDRQ